MGDKEDQKADDLSFELRQNINDAYAFVEGAKSTQTFSSLTFDDLMVQQTLDLLSKGTESRPGPIPRIDKVERQLKSTIEQIKKVPPEAFRLRDERDAVNTPAAGDDPDK
jgi:hypothetical protein